MSKEQVARAESLEPRFDPETGLLPAVVQDARSGRVLMLGYMNAEALARTESGGRVTFFSRSRQELWTKGATSGNWLEPVEIRADCDGDALLVRAIAHGPTCHTGAVSCFGEPAQPAVGEVLCELFEVIESRRRERPEGSYTATLFEDGPARIGRKVEEEAREVSTELVDGGGRVDEEAADLVYHLLVLLAAAGQTPADIARVLAARRG